MSRVIIPILVIAIVVLGLGALMLDRGLQRSRVAEDQPEDAAPRSGAVYTGDFEIAPGPTY